jgi:hypothetical protein
MLLFFTDPTLEEFNTKGQSVQEQLGKIKSAFDKGIELANLQKSLVAIDNEAKKLSRTLGSGVVMNSNTFRDSLFQIQQNVGDLNIGFDGVIEAVQSVADTTGKMTLPTEKVTTQMLEIGKAAGIGNKEIGTMVGTFMAFTKGQQTAVKEMAKISKIARETGLNATKLLTSISADLGKLDKYNFKKGTDGLTSMAAEAQRLGTTISDIGIFDIADSLVDPEKAIEAAANMSMLGTSVDGLTNPFQLLNDSANNVENLQSKMIDLAKSAFKIDEATGTIETNFVSQQKLKAQVEAMGGSYDKFLQLGRAAAKEQLVQNKLLASGLDLSSLSEEQINLVKSLAEIGPGGEIQLNLPTGTFPDLGKDVKGLGTALTEYQKTANLSDRDLALKSLNLEEEIQVDTRTIRDAALKQLTSAERTEIMLKMKKGAEESAEVAKTASKGLASVTVKAAKELSSVYGNYMTKFTTFKPSDVTLKEKQKLENVAAEEVGKTGSDMLFGADNIKTLSLGKGEIFNFIKEDEAIFAPNAIENLGVLKDVYMQTMGIAKSIPSEVKLIEPASTKTGEISKQIVETNTNVVTTNKNEDTINLNINLNIDGRNLPNNLSDMLFKNPSTVRELENKVMDVLDKQDILRRSKGRFIKR